MLERMLREVSRRTRVVGNTPDGNSAVMLVAARLKHVASLGATDEKLRREMKKIRTLLLLRSSNNVPHLRWVNSP